MQVFRSFLPHLMILLLFISSCKEEIPERNPLDVGSETRPEFYPKIALPADADTTKDYWKGIDLLPKPPVLPLPVAEEQKRFILPEGYEMEAVLTEPQIEQPAQVIFDGNGRMYVLELRTYMLTVDSDSTLTPKSVISRWEDLDKDGVYEKGTDFVSGLIFPRFVLPYGENAVLTMESNQDVVYKYIDTNNDGKADKREFFTDDFGRSGNVEHQQAFLYWGMDNWLYSTVNPFRIRETKKGVVREPTGSNMAQWGITHDDDGKLWFQGGSNGVPSYFQFPIHYGDYEVKDQFEEGFDVPWGAPILIADMQGGMGQIRQPDGSLNKVTGASGNDIYRGDRLPKTLYGQYFYGEPVARIVRQVNPVVKEGLTTLQNVYQSQKSEFLKSTDPLFRPVDMATAPDGTMYICDMYHGIIQEGQWTKDGSYLRTKIQQYQLDKVIRLGRIWRLKHKTIARDQTVPRMYSQKTKDLIPYLSHPNGWWRDMAQQVIVQRGDQSVAKTLEQISLGSGNINARFHALWCLEGIGSLRSEIVRKLLKDPNPRMKIMAMYAGESVYKKGDISLGADFLKLTQDQNEEVVMRAMMTARVLEITGKEASVKMAMSKSKSAGIQLVGSQVLNPPVVTAFFGRQGKRYAPQDSILIAKGAKIYQELCATCHGKNGKGNPASDGVLMAPSFVSSTRIKWHPDYVVKTILRGLSGELQGEKYAGIVMVPMADNNDEWIAAVSSYIRANFDNEASLVSPDYVAKLRKETASQTKPYTFKELYATTPKIIPYEKSWKASASHSAPTRPGSNAMAEGAFNFEGWTSGTGQTKGMWFQIDLPKQETISQIEFNSQAFPVGKGRDTKYIPAQPYQYVLKSSVDGKVWKDVLKSKSERSPTVMQFDPIKTKMLRVELTGPDTVAVASWSMDGLKLYGK